MHPGPILFAKSLAIVFLVQTRGRADDKPNDSATAFPPLSKPGVPESSGPFPRNPIDAFVVAVQKTAGLTPSGEADRTTLIRRLSIYLIGLPPSPD